MGAPQGAVVVGVTDGPDARRALPWAAAEAKRREAPLHLLHAIGPGLRAQPAPVSSAGCGPAPIACSPKPPSP